MTINLNDGKTGWLKKEEFQKPLLLTIKSFEWEKVGEGSMPSLVMYFHEMERGLVMNNTNIDVLTGKIAMSNDGEEAIGKKVVVYNDPDVMFGGRKTGGLRIRPPKPEYAAAPAPTPEDTAAKASFDQQQNEPNKSGATDDIPF